RACRGSKAPTMSKLNNKRQSDQIPTSIKPAFIFSSHEALLLLIVRFPTGLGPQAHLAQETQA
ncbi:MAG: hypothetical protein ACYSTG_04715, partial [Planctomycetota bacterium]